MKRSTILELTLLSIVLSPFAVLAQSDNQYPAASFQPKVVFADEALIAASKSAKQPAASVSEHTSNTATDSEYPAANFQPKVVFIDESAAKSTKAGHASAKSTAKKTEFDPKYPAASFEPKIVFSGSAS